MQPLEMIAGTLKRPFQLCCHIVNECVCCRASTDKDGLADDSRVAVSTMPISPAGPTASDLLLSKSLEETLKSFNMFESEEGMQARLPL